MINVSCRILNLGIIKHLCVKKPPRWKSRDLSSSCLVRESRSETGWDLGPWNNCINVQLGEILDKKIKKKKKQHRKTHLPLLKSRERKQFGSKSRVQHMLSALNTTWRMGKTPKPPLWPDPGAYPCPHPIISIPPTWGVSKGTSYLFLLPPVAAGVPVKPDLNFLSGL